MTSSIANYHPVQTSFTYSLGPPMSRSLRGYIHCDESFIQKIFIESIYGPELLLGDGSMEMPKAYLQL